MKNTQTCPKCDGRKLWRTETLRYYDDTKGPGTNRTLRIALNRRVEDPAIQSAWGELWHGDSPNRYNAGSFDAYICAGCSYVELYAVGTEGLEHNPESGVHFIDATPQQGGFR